jgi:hypothetical protein
MQCQVNDAFVDNTPKFLTSDPTDHTHALTMKDPDHPVQTVFLPLALQGVTFLLNVRAPTFDEWNSDTFKWLHLTPESLTWDPTTTFYEEQEAAMIDNSEHVVTATRSLRGHVNHLVINLLSSLTTDQADITDDKKLHNVWPLMFRSQALRLALMDTFACPRLCPLTPRP